MFVARFSNLLGGSTVYLTMPHFAPSAVLLHLTGRAQLRHLLSISNIIHFSEDIIDLSKVIILRAKCLVHIKDVCLLLDAANL